MSDIDTKIFTKRDKEQFLKDYAIAYLAKHGNDYTQAAWGFALQAWGTWVKDIGLNTVHFSGDDEEDTAESETKEKAESRLIETQSDLVAACEELLDMMQNAQNGVRHPDPASVYTRAAQAVSKAKGV